MIRSLLASVSIGCLALVSSSSSAQDAGCDPVEELGPVEVTPSAGATGVRQNSVIRVRYSDGYFRGSSTPTESIMLSTSGVPVTGRTELAGDDTLYFIPDSPLTPDLLYEGTATGAVFPFDFSFRTIAGNDVANPDLRSPASDGSLRVASSAVDSSCAEPRSRRIRLEFASATDDGPASSLEYWVYLTRAEGLEAPRLLARVRDYGAEVTTVGAILGPEESSRSACVSVVAVDGLDRASEWSGVACFDPQTGTGFESLCSASPRGEPARGPLIAVVAACLALLTRSRGRSRALTRASRS